MASTNQSPFFKRAQERYLEAKTKEEKIVALEEMIKECPKHKSSEKMLANLKTRLIKIKKELERDKLMSKKLGKRDILLKKTGDALVSLIGLTNVGKSSLLTKLTNAKPKIADYEFTTSIPEIGTLDVGGCKIQIAELPSLKLNEEEDRRQLSVMRMSSLLVILGINDEQFSNIELYLKKINIRVPKLFILSKYDIYLKSTKANLFISSKTDYNLSQLKELIFSKLNLIRVLTKEPGKPSSNLPIILEKDSKIKDIARKVHKDFLTKFSHALLWGPSAKFLGQRVGLNHVLKDHDLVEIYLKK